MKKIKICLAISILLVIALSTVLNGTENFAEVGTNEEIINDWADLMIDETILESEYDPYVNDIKYNDVYIIEDTARITTDVNGNVFIISSNVDISDVNINGNVFICGNMVKMQNTNINGSVFIAGNSINLDIKANELYAAGNKVSLQENSVIDRSVRIASSEANLKGNIYQNAYIAAENIFVSDNAKIAGDLEYHSTKEASIPAGVVGGNIEFIEYEETENSAVTFQGFYMLSLFYKITTTLVITLFVLFCTSKTSNSKENKITIGRFFAALGIGFLALITIPAICIFLLITIIGIPLSLILLSLYILMLLIAFSITSIEITSYIINKFKPEQSSKLAFIGIVTVVTIVMWGLTKIPFIGFWFGSTFGLTGMGLTVLNIFKKDKNSIKKQEKDAQIVNEEK